jgi:5-methyltetrahydropteroyltriglutamate--homocysteine methyltransferase
VAALEVVRLQEKAGVDIVTDGEQRRDNFYSFVAEKLAGTQLMTLLEMLDIVEDKASFERVLQLSTSLPTPCATLPVSAGSSAASP